MIRRRFKHFMPERIELSTTGQETLLSVSEYYGVKPRAEVFDGDAIKSRAESLEGYRRVYVGDFVMNYMLAWKGAYGVSDYDGIVSPAYAVYRVNPLYADRRFIHHRLRSAHMRSVFKARSKGIIESRLRLYPDAFLSMGIDLPDLATQCRIASFLDRETARIDRLVERKRRLTELLAERRRALVTHAVTGGLDADTRTTSRGGGVSRSVSADERPEWTACIPDSWGCDRLKWQVDLCTTRQAEGEGETLPYISNEDIAPWTGKLLNEEPKASEVYGRTFQKDDVLFNKLRPYLAKVYHAEFDGVSSGELLCLRATRTVEPRFLFYVLTSNGFIDAVNAESFGAKMPRADWKIVGHQPVPLPPLATQRLIAAFLERETAHIDRLVEMTQRSIVLLGEVRSALITAAVTGQIDVATWENRGQTDRRLDRIEEETQA